MRSLGGPTRHWMRICILPASPFKCRPSSIQTIIPFPPYITMASSSQGDPSTNYLTSNQGQKISDTDNWWVTELQTWRAPSLIRNSQVKDIRRHSCWAPSPGRSTGAWEDNAFRSRAHPRARCPRPRHRCLRLFQSPRRSSIQIHLRARLDRSFTQDACVCTF